MDFPRLVSYLVAVAVVVAIPGPNILLVVSDAVRHGLRSSVSTIIGIKIGTSVVFLVAFSGLIVLFNTVLLAFTLVKWLGAGYLVYLGLSQILDSNTITTENAREQQQRPKAFFAKGVLVSVTNVKGYLFASAFFPQFMVDDMSVVLQFGILCGVFLIESFAIELCYAMAGDAARKALWTGRFQRIVTKVGGGILVGFGASIVFVDDK